MELTKIDVGGRELYERAVCGGCGGGVGGAVNTRERDVEI